MKLSLQIARWIVSLVVCLTLTGFSGPSTVLAAGAVPTPSPALLRFTEQVKNGQGAVLRGVYVEGVMSLDVVQPPPGNDSFVPSVPGMVSQYQPLASRGVVGLLAHNTLAGRLFFNLQPGMIVWLVYGDGQRSGYQVREIHSYQKLLPNDPQSELVDLGSKERVSTLQVFNRYYRGLPHLTFQTCLERYGWSNWGLTFVSATPLESAHPGP